MTRWEFVIAAACVAALAGAYVIYRCGFIPAVIQRIRRGW